MFTSDTAREYRGGEPLDDKDAQLERSPLASRKGVVAAAIGNAVEYFDFGTYATFAVLLGNVFFPSKSPFLSLMLSVSAFGLGFVVRPLAAFFIGVYADRVGRKQAMTLTLWLMAIGTGTMAVLPGYEQIGVAAPILLVVTRLIQGVAWGGEAGPATTFILESAPPEKRASYACWQVTSQGIAAVAAGLVGWVLSTYLSEYDLKMWGWRIPFLLGMAVLPIGIYMRRRLADTLESENVGQTTREIVVEIKRNHYVKVIYGVMILLGSTITQFFINYLTTYAMVDLHLPTNVSMLATLISGGTLAIFAVIGGVLCDRFGRKPILLVPRLMLLLLIYPTLQLLSNKPTVTVFLSCVFVMSVFQALSGAALIVLIAESFPRKVRSTGFSITYAFAISVFGGTAQIIISWLIGSTGNGMAPVWYLIVANIICIVAATLSKETHPFKAAKA